MPFTWHCPMESRQSCIIFSFRKTEKSSSSHESTRKQSFPWRTSEQTSLYGSFVRQARWLTQLQGRPESGEQDRYDCITPSRSIDSRWAHWHLRKPRRKWKQILSNLQHLQQTPSAFQSNIRLSLLYPLNISKMHLIYHYPYFNLNCCHLCSGSEHQTFIVSLLYNAVSSFQFLLQLYPVWSFMELNLNLLFIWLKPLQRQTPGYFFPLLLWSPLHSTCFTNHSHLPTCS